MEREQKARRICAGLFLIYMLVMVYLLFLQRTPSAEAAYNLHPLHTIRHQLRLLAGGAFVRFAYVNLVGNVIMFLPLGLLPGIWKRQRKPGWYALTTALGIAAVEAAQYLTRLGSADIDDWILNMVGALMGFEFWRTVSKRRRCFDE